MKYRAVCFSILLQSLQVVATLADGKNMNTPSLHHRCRAISLDPAFKKAWMRRGMVRHSRGKYAGSVADFNEALLLDPNDKHAKKLREHSAAKEREVFC